MPGFIAAKSLPNSARYAGAFGGNAAPIYYGPTRTLSLREFASDRPVPTIMSPICIPYSYPRDFHSQSRPVNAGLNKDYLRKISRWSSPPPSLLSLNVIWPQRAQIPERHFGCRVGGISRTVQSVRYRNFCNTLLQYGSRSLFATSLMSRDAVGDVQEPCKNVL